MSCWRLLAMGLLLAAAVPMRAEPPPKRKIPRELLEMRLNAARVVYELDYVRIMGGPGQPPELFGWSERILKAELPLCESKVAREAAYKANLARLRNLERLLKTYDELFPDNHTWSADAAAATFDRLEAEIEYFQLTGKQAPSDAGDWTIGLPHLHRSRDKGGPRLPNTPKEDVRNRK
jgi:hypothetical protein